MLDSSGEYVAWTSGARRWQRLDSGAWSDIDGATGRTYTLSTADVGKQVRFRIRHGSTTYHSYAYPVGSTVQPATTPHLTGFSVSSTSRLASNTYGVGEAIKFRGAFSAAVDVTGSPRLEISLGNQVRWAVYESGSGTDALVFSHTVEASRHATGGIGIATASPVRNNKLGMFADGNAVKMTTIDLRGGTIRASGTTTDAVLTTNHGPCCSPTHRVNADPNAASKASAADPPTVSGAPAVSASGPDGEWGPGETVEVTLTFSEVVTVDTGGGTPAVEISLGGTATRSATYLRGSGTTALVFGYTLADADGSHTSMFVTPNGLALNDGTIRSKATGVDADITHAGKAESGSATGTRDLSGKKAQEPPGPRGEEQQPPPAPTGLTATVNSDGHVVLNWSAPNDDSVTGYQVLRRRPSMGENSLQVHVEDTGSTTTTYTDTDVTAGTQHVYRVKAINAAGQSRWSNYVNKTPPQ